MKIKKYISLLAVAGALFSSCEKNDTVLDLGDTIGLAPKVYMENLDPSYSVDQTISVPILYWLETKKYGDFMMYHSYDSVATVKINSVANIGYLYENEFEGEYMEQELYKTEYHDPANWRPEEYAYKFDSKYTVASDLAKEKFNQNSISADDFVAKLSPDFFNAFYKSLAYGMTNVQLELLIVEMYGSYTGVTQEEFYTYFNEEGGLLIITDNDGNQEYYGETKMVEAFHKIPKTEMIGDRYSYENKNKIVLQYKIETLEGSVGESSYRSFTVK